MNSCEALVWVPGVGPKHKGFQPDSHSEVKRNPAVMKKVVQLKRGRDEDQQDRVQP